MPSADFCIPRRSKLACCYISTLSSLDGNSHRPDTAEAGSCKSVAVREKPCSRCTQRQSTLMRKALVALHAGTTCRATAGSAPAMHAGARAASAPAEAAVLLFIVPLSAQLASSHCVAPLRKPFQPIHGGLCCPSCRPRPRPPHPVSALSCRPGCCSAPRGVAPSPLAAVRAAGGGVGVLVVAVARCLVVVGPLGGTGTAECTRRRAPQAALPRAAAAQGSRQPRASGVGTTGKARYIAHARHWHPARQTCRYKAPPSTGTNPRPHLWRLSMRLLAAVLAPM